MTLKPIPLLTPANYDVWTPPDLVAFLLELAGDERRSGCNPPWVVALGPEWLSYLAAPYAEGISTLNLACRIVESPLFMAVTVSSKMEGWDVALYDVARLCKPKPSKGRRRR